MSFQVILSPLNSITFVPEQVNGAFIGKDWLVNRLQYNVNNRRTNFQQPVNLSNPQCVQLHISDNPDSLTFTLYSCTGENLEDIESSYAVTDIYNTYDDNGNTVYFDTYQYDFRFLDTGFANTAGVYFCRITATWGSTTRHFVSEPLNVKTEHSGCMLLQYTSDVNRLETLFEYFPTNFALLVPLQIGTFSPQREEVDFTTQNQRLIKTASHPYDLTTLVFNRIPDYILQKLNHIFTCDRFKIAESVFTTNEPIEAERSGTNPLYRASIQVRDYNLQQSYSYKIGTTITLLNPPKKPFYLFKMTMFDGYRVIPINALQKLIEDNTDYDDWIDDLNNILAPQQGLSGTFVNDSGVLKYLNGADESFTNYELIAAFEYISYNVNTSTTNQPFIFEVINYKGAIDWGDGRIDETTDPPNTAYYNMSHTYAVADDYVIRVFGVTGEGIRVPANLAIGNVTNVGGTVAPTNLVTYAISKGNAPTTLSVTFLHSAKNTLKHFIITGANVDAVDGLDIPGAAKWGDLAYVDLTRNSLSVANVNQVLQNLLANTVRSGATAGSILVNLQTPTATPTGTGLAAKNNLTYLGWAVTTD